MDKKHYVIEYEFNFDNGQKKNILITLDSRTLKLIHCLDVVPDWTRLEYCKCRCCPLDPQIYAHCPAALNLVAFVKEAEQYDSSQPCRVTCKTYLRMTTSAKKLMIQDVFASVLFDMLMTSDCPFLSLLRPLVKSHVPFVSLREAVIRATSIVLLGHYFKSKKKSSQQIITFEEFYAMFESLQAVYHGLLTRIKDQSQKDAGLNAFIIIESLNQLISMDLSSGLSSIEPLFHSWMR